MDIVLREAGLDDAELVAQLTRQSWAGKVAPSSSGHREDVERVLDDLHAGGGFILMQDETPIGSVRWRPLDDDHDVWEIMRMGILPAWRGQNLSEHLLEAVIHHAQSCKVSELRLALRGDAPQLQDFYAAFGFESAPEIEYSQASQDAPPPWVMRKFLYA
ncbi:GNAT family N-acetyltransferase [Massilia sp. W12]|uniref:GNAT family N-acetyltransferase n=1 Tax=Massilia sp. W12 TaxID=3126507 RepID=UPI0030D2E7EA